MKYDNIQQLKCSNLLTLPYNHVVNVLLCIKSNPCRLPQAPNNSLLCFLKYHNIPFSHNKLFQGHYNQKDVSPGDSKLVSKRKGERDGPSQGTASKVEVDQPVFSIDNLAYHG